MERVLRSGAVAVKKRGRFTRLGDDSDQEVVAEVELTSILDTENTRELTKLAY